MTAIIISAVLLMAFFVLIAVRNQWVYRNMQKLIRTDQTIQVFTCGYDWIMVRFWKWNFAKAVAEFKASRLNPTGQGMTQKTGKKV